jgi:hypothetical protein
MRKAACVFVITLCLAVTACGEVLPSRSLTIATREAKVDPLEVVDRIEGSLLSSGFSRDSSDGYDVINQSTKPARFYSRQDGFIAGVDIESSATVRFRISYRPPALARECGRLFIEIRDELHRTWPQAVLQETP